LQCWGCKNPVTGFNASLSSISAQGIVASTNNNKSNDNHTAGFSGTEIGSAFLMNNLGAIISPFFIGCLPSLLLFCLR